MSELLRSLGCLALISGAGAEINSLLFTSIAGRRKCGEHQQSSSWGWSYLVGVAALSIYLYAALNLYGRITPSAFATAWAGCSILSGFWLVRNWGSAKWWAAFRHSWWFDLPAPVGCAVLLLFIVAAWLAVDTKPTSFDGRATFALKARILFDQGSLESEDFQDVNRVHLHSRYPLLIPLTEAELFWAQGSIDDLHVRTMFLAFAIALTSILAGEFLRYCTPRMAALATALFLGVPLLCQIGEGSGISTEADFPLACYVTAGTLAIMQWLRDGKARQAVLGGLMFGAAAMTKDEGMLWAAAASLTIMMGVGCRRIPLNRIASPTAWLGVVVFMIMLSLAIGVRRQIPVSPYLRNYAAVLQWDWLRQLWRRPAVVVWYGLKNLFRTSKWNLIWPCICASLCLRRKPLSADVWCARVLAAMMAVCVLGIFVLTPYPLYWHLQTALFRLCLQLLPLFWLVAVEQLSASDWTSQLSDRWAAAAKESRAVAILPLERQVGPHKARLVDSAETKVGSHRKLAG